VTPKSASKSLLSVSYTGKKLVFCQFLPLVHYPAYPVPAERSDVIPFPGKSVKKKAVPPDRYDGLLAFLPVVVPVKNDYFTPAFPNSPDRGPEEPKPFPRGYDKKTPHKDRREYPGIILKEITDGGGA
jgi:hypothetical protein